MKKKITKTLIEEIVPSEKSYEIHDTEVNGFLVRVLPSGTITYMIVYRWQGKKNRITIGRSKVLTPQQAREEAKRILAEKCLGTDPNINKLSKKAPPVTHTLRSFIEAEYKKWRIATKTDGATTIQRIKSIFEEFLDTPLSELNVLDADRFRTKRLVSGTKAVTINRDFDDLKSLLTTAVEWGAISANPLADLKRLKTDGLPVIRYLLPDEEKRLFEALATREKDLVAARDRGNAWRQERGYPLLPYEPDYLQPMIVVSLNTGIRWGTLVQLEWKDVDLDNAILTVRAEIEKTKKNRHIPLNSKVLGVLKTWKESTVDETLPATDQNLIFPGKNGAVRDNIKKSWATVKKMAGIKAFRWHDMRHTFASKLVQRGVDLNTVRELMGHADIKMTLRYAHLAPEHKAAAVAVLV